jgi:hypothetical protein
MKTYTATMKDGGQISFVVSRSLNRAMFVGKDLLAVGADRTYQLWTPEGQRAIPDNLVPGGGDRKEFFREAISGVTGLAVSVEAAGGAQQPPPSTIQTVTELAGCACLLAIRSLPQPPAPSCAPAPPPELRTGC